MPVVLKPETNAKKNKSKIEINDQTIKDPQIMAEEFNKFYVEKVQKLAAGIKRSNINLTIYWG